MNINNMSKSEIEALSSIDIAFLILKSGKKLNTLELFKEVCKYLQIDPDTCSDRIGNFYTSLSTDCRFLILEDAKWDIRDNHVVKVDIESDDEEEIEEENIEEIENEEEIEEDIDSEDLDEDIENDELEELSVIDEEDIDK